MKLERLDHFGLEVGDLARAEKFYTQVLGLGVVTHLGDQVLLDCGGQNLALFRGMTTLDNIMAGRALKMRCGFFWQLIRHGPALKEEVEHRHRVEEIIDFLEIAAIRKIQVGRLPYGLQKRVELGRALAMEPDLLLLDEPMAGMNLEEKEDMSRFILDVNQQYGTTIALIEHDMGVVMDLSDRVVVLEYGRKIADATPDEVKRDKNVIRAYLGEPHGVSV